MLCNDSATSAINDGVLLLHSCCVRERAFVAVWVHMCVCAIAYPTSVLHYDSSQRLCRKFQLAVVRQTVFSK